MLYMFICHPKSNCESGNRGSDVSLEAFSNRSPICLCVLTWESSCVVVLVFRVITLKRERPWGFSWSYLLQGRFGVLDPLASIRITRICRVREGPHWGQMLVTLFIRASSVECDTFTHHFVSILPICLAAQPLSTRHLSVLPPTVLVNHPFP